MLLASKAVHSRLIRTYYNIALNWVNLHIWGQRTVNSKRTEGKGGTFQAFTIRCWHLEYCLEEQKIHFDRWYLESFNWLFSTDIHVSEFSFTGVFAESESVANTHANMCFSWAFKAATCKSSLQFGKLPNSGTANLPHDLGNQSCCANNVPWIIAF